jgi:peptidoglycan biosynthesis protein MviN/MurJ (putative lipid II flippase)
MHDSKTPVIVATAVVALNVVCSALTVHPFGINGLAASNSLASLVEAVVLGLLLTRRIGIAEGALVTTSFWATGAASVAMAIVASSIATALWHVAAPFWQHCAVLALAMLAGAVVLVLVGAALRVKELAELWSFVTTRTSGARSPA